MRDASPMPPRSWRRELLACRAEQQGQVTRRKTRGIEGHVSMAPVPEMPRKRGFRTVENRGLAVFVCNRDPIRRIF